MSERTIEDEYYDLLHDTDMQRDRILKLLDSILEQISSINSDLRDSDKRKKYEFN